MHSLRSGRRVAVVTLVLLASNALAQTRAAVSAPQTAGTTDTSDAKVALTFDDLPVHGALPPGRTRIGVVQSIIETLRTWHAPPSYGFVNARALDEAPENARVLALWREAGHLLGNHTFSHIDLHANTVEAFERDVIANEPALRAAMGAADWHWLRFPYLREGDTLEKRRAVRAFLGDQGYRVAEVTLSFDDYAYNDPYARCVARNDTAALDGLAASYLSRASQRLSAVRQEAKRLYGRDVKHVMLLHVGGFQMIMLPKLMELLQQRGFGLVTLEEAERDSAYAVDPDVPSAGGATLLDLMRSARGIPAIPRAEEPLAQLDAVCR